MEKCIDNSTLFEYTEVKNVLERLKMTNKNEIVKKSHELVNARYILPVGAMKLICFCASLIEANDTSFDTIVVHAKAFQEITKVENPYEELKNIADALFDAELSIVDEKGMYRERKRWVTTMRYYEGEGKAEFKFHDDVKPFLLELKDKAVEYNRNVLDNLFNKYSIRIYELLIQNVEGEPGKHYECVLEIDYLRALLVLDERYTRFTDLRRYVLEPVCAELNSTDLENVEFEIIKTGRIATALKFKYKI